MLAGSVRGSVSYIKTHFWNPLSTSAFLYFLESLHNALCVSTPLLGPWTDDLWPASDHCSTCHPSTTVWPLIPYPTSVPKNHQTDPIVFSETGEREREREKELGKVSKHYASGIKLLWEVLKVISPLEDCHLNHCPGSLHRRCQVTIL